MGYRYTTSPTGKPTYGSIATIPEMVEDPPEFWETKEGTTQRRTASLISSRAGLAVLLVMMLCGAVVVLVPTPERIETTARPTIAETALVPDEPSPSAILLDEAYDGKPLFYKDQHVDHFPHHRQHPQNGNDNEELYPPNATYRQRYYKSSQHFGGPGHPILVIMGGEAALEPPMLYPFVHQGLASEFGAFCVSPEHRFYGASQPTANNNNNASLQEHDDYESPSVAQMMAYLTPDQALEDAVQLIRWVQTELGCHSDRTHPDYCPVITFGGSYPGFLSAMLRFRYPDLVDGSYASSAPLELYSQEVESSAYFDKITQVAEASSPGCSDSVRSTLYAVRDQLVSEFSDQPIVQAASAVGFCPRTLPSYIQTMEEFVSETIQYLVPAVFADLNMDYYPPGPETGLARACAIFQDTDQAPMDKIRRFFRLRNEIEYGNTATVDNGNTNDNDNDNDDGLCFDLALELPGGPNARIRGSDNSGSGGGWEGRIWEFQCCKDLVVKAGYSPESMFLPRPFSYEWHHQHCLFRFPGMTVQPHRLNQEWGFSNLTQTSQILFANGANDGWSVASVTNTTQATAAATATATSVHPPEIVVVNFPNGAHHSELKAGPYPNPRDTPDILEGYDQTREILSGWLDEIAFGQEEAAKQTPH